MTTPRTYLQDVIAQLERWRRLLEQAATASPTASPPLALTSPHLLRQVDAPSTMGLPAPVRPVAPRDPYLPLEGADPPLEALGSPSGRMRGSLYRRPGTGRRPPIAPVERDRSGGGSLYRPPGRPRPVPVPRPELPIEEQPFTPVADPEPPSTSQEPSASPPPSTSTLPPAVRASSPPSWPLLRTAAPVPVEPRDQYLPIGHDLSKSDLLGGQQHHLIDDRPTDASSAASEVGGHEALAPLNPDLGANYTVLSPQDPPVAPRVPPPWLGHGGDWPIVGAEDVQIEWLADIGEAAGEGEDGR